MKAVIALTATLTIAGASASLLPRQIDQLPSCALSCALTSLGSTGCPSQTDFACICKASQFITNLAPCVQTACSPADLEKTIQAAGVICAGAGVSLSIPPGVLPTNTAGTSSAETSAPASTTEASSAPSSMVTSVATESSAASNTAAATTSAAPTTRAGGNATVTSTSPPQPTGSPGAASRNAVALGGLGAIVALFAAFL